MAAKEPQLDLLASGVSEEGPWIVLEKPSGWHTLDGRSGGPNVEAALRRLRPDVAALPEAGLVHRLDLGTSGCLLASTTAEGRERWRARWSRRGIRGVSKSYLATVLLPEDVGAFPQTGGFLLHYRSRYRRSAKVTVSDRGVAEERGECRWRTIRRDGRRSELEIELLGPGRRHQIRAGFASLGAPLLGDDLYGGPPADRLHLHAWRLAFDEHVVESRAPQW